MTCTSTGTFFWAAKATVTGTSPPMPPLRPPFPEPPPGGAPAALAPEFPQLAKISAMPIMDRIQRIFRNDRWPRQSQGTQMNIRLILYWRLSGWYSYALRPAMAPKRQDYGTFLQLGFGRRQLAGYHLVRKAQAIVRTIAKGLVFGVATAA